MSTPMECAGPSVQPWTSNLQPAVIIPTCERPISLRQACISALHALPSNGELIVVDDGIERSATSALSQLDDKRLKIVSTSGYQGPSAARNLGARCTSADVLFFLDDDDVMIADYIAKAVHVLEADGHDIDFGFSAALWERTVIGRKKSAGRISQNSELENRMAGLGMGFWIRRNVYHSIGGLDENIRINEDTDLCLRLAKANTNGWYFSEPGVRLCATQTGRIEQPRLTETTPPSDRLIVFERFLEQYDDLLSTNNKLRKRFAFRAAKYRARCESFWQAFRNSRHLLPPTSQATLFLAVFFWRVEHHIRSRSA